MTDVWTGDIALQNGETIKNVGLSLSHHGPSPIQSNATLHFLATVDTARIPLYLTAGPNLAVWTTEEKTEAWFESVFFNKPVVVDNGSEQANTPEWWNIARSQGPIGILVQVQNEPEDTIKSTITELLFYGVIDNTIPSSATQDRDNLPRLHVHALPLSSDRLRPQICPPVPENGACFLSALHQSLPQIPSPKRKRDIFDEATIANRKAKGRGGAGIAAAAARGKESQQSHADRRSLSNASGPDPRLPASKGGPPRPPARSLSQSSSINLTSEQRPRSTKTPLSASIGKRFSLSHPPAATESEEPTAESRNKEALSKVVMAAMRMHGLQQRKKGKVGEAGESHDGSVVVEETDRDDEYKIVYHQTFKGAVLAFRKHISTLPLHAQPDTLRNVVEKLLSIFLNDPLAAQVVNKTSSPVAMPGSKTKLGENTAVIHVSSPFDLPSTARPRLNRAITDTEVGIHRVTSQ